MKGHLMCRSPFILRILVLILLFAVCRVGPAFAGGLESAGGMDALRETLDNYIHSQGNLRTRIEVRKLVRISSGRLSEKTYHVESIIRDHVARISRYSEGVIDGQKQWFDIRETLLFPSGETAEWRHPGFPGQLSFGIRSAHAHRIGFDAGLVGSPVFNLQKIRRVIGRSATTIVSEDQDQIVARTSAVEKPKTDNLLNDYIEIVFSKRFGRLPISMTRISNTDEPTRNYDSGSCIHLKYGTSDDGTIIPLMATHETGLKEREEGIVQTTWHYLSFDVSSQPTIDEMKLTIPVQVLVANVDSRQQFTVTSTNDDVAAALKKRFGDFLEIEPRNASMRTVAASFVGQCPDLPDVFRQAKEPTSNYLPPAGNNGRWNYGLLAAHGLGLWAIGCYARRRRNLAPT